MQRERSESSAKLAHRSTAPVAPDHGYAMDVTEGSAKRKIPNTPTKTATPPSKVIVSNKNDAELSALTEAIGKLTVRFDEFGDQLRQNSVMVASLAKVVEVNSADIKACSAKLRDLEKLVPALVKENAELKERVVEQERYKRRWNLKIHGLKEKNDENTRKEVLAILSKITPHCASTLDLVVDTVHRLGIRQVGRHRPIIIQFTMRFYADLFWELTKNSNPNSKTCKELGISFKKDLCKADREARAAVWPKMATAKDNGAVIYFRGHVGYINGVRVVPD